MERRWLLLVLVLCLALRRRNEPGPGPSLPPPPTCFCDRLLTLINHQVTVHTAASTGFDGVVTAVNPDFLTLCQRVSPPQAAFIPLHMISAVTVSAE